MKIVLIVVGVILVALVVLITVNYYRMKNAKPVANSKRIRILTNKNFKAFTKKGVVLVDFWASWCSPCKILSPVLNDLADSQDDFMVAKVNVDQYPQLPQKFKVKNIPTMIILKNGKEVGRITGVKTKRAIQKEVQAFL